MTSNIDRIREQLDEVCDLVSEHVELMARSGSTDLQAAQILESLCRSQRELVRTLDMERQDVVLRAPVAFDEVISTPTDPAPPGFCTLPAEDWLCPVCGGMDVTFLERVTATRARPRADQNLILLNLQVMCEECGYSGTTGSMAEHIRRSKLNLPPLPQLEEQRTGDAAAGHP